MYTAFTDPGAAWGWWLVHCCDTLCPQQVHLTSNLCEAGAKG